MIRQRLVSVAWKRCLQVTKQTCCRAHLCLLMLMLHARTCCCRPCVWCLSLAGSSCCCWLPTTGQSGVCDPDSPRHAGQRRKSPNRNRLFQKSNHNSISGHKIKARWTTHVGDHFPKINFKINRVDWEKFQITRTQAKNRSLTQNSPDLRSCEDSSDFLRWKCSTHVIEQIKARKTRSNDSQTKKSRTLELGVGEEREEHKSQHKQDHHEHKWIKTPRGHSTDRGCTSRIFVSLTRVFSGILKWG